MKQTLCLFAGIFLLNTVYGIEINPMRQTVPDQFIDPPGKRFSIFAGDPERVQKANEVDVKAFKSELVAEPLEASRLKLSEEREPTINLKFTVHNSEDKSYTLSFPDAQRYDIRITNESGGTVYLWSADKAFVREIGRTFINKRESIILKPSPPVNLSKALGAMPPGTYTISMWLSNYPEVEAKTEWKLLP